MGVEIACGRRVFPVYRSESDAFGRNGFSNFRPFFFGFLFFIGSYLYLWGESEILKKMKIEICNISLQSINL